MIILCYLHKFLSSTLRPETVLRQHQVVGDDSQRLSFLKEDQLLDCTLHSEKHVCLAVLVHTVDLTYIRDAQR